MKNQPALFDHEDTPLFSGVPQTVEEQTFSRPEPFGPIPCDHDAILFDYFQYVDYVNNFRITNPDQEPMSVHDWYNSGLREEYRK